MPVSKRFFAIALLLGSLLTGCGGNPAWDGPDDGSDKRMPAAEQACECIYATMDGDEDISVSDVLAEIPAWQRALSGEDVSPDETEAIMDILGREESFANTLDNTSCMKEVEDELFRMGIDFEDFGELLEQHCQLAMFYI